jgi:hypothetical protein
MKSSKLPNAVTKLLTRLTYCTLDSQWAENKTQLLDEEGSDLVDLRILDTRFSQLQLMVHRGQ